MLQEYPITKCSKRCHITGRIFEPGENYISMLTTQGDELVRVDVAADQWQQPPENSIGWWKCRMPADQRRGSRLAPNSVLLDTLSELLTRDNQAPVAYLLALLLVRRRVLVEEQHLHLEQAEHQPAIWQLIQPTDGRKWEVPVIDSDPEQLRSYQDSLMNLLFTDE
jgi:hypothetical protein